MPNAFFVERVEEKRLIFDEIEAHHMKVVRVKPGDELVATDGKGTLYEFVLQELSKNYSVGRMLSKKVFHHDDRTIIVSVASMKWPRLRLILEKSTELGADRIEIFNCERTVARVDQRKVEKFRRIVKEAAKQSVNPFLPEVVIHEKLPRFNSDDLNIFLDFKKESISTLQEKIRGSNVVRIIVGPEGGFTKEEIREMQQDSISVSLGSRILRTETAVIASLSFVNFSIGRM